jgi:hypothetical protein
MSRWTRLALVLACCALFSACNTETPARPHLNAEECSAACNGADNKCTQGCDPDDIMCPEACTDAVATCHSHCG